MAADLNVPVAARVVTFLQPPPSGATTAAILYDPADPASEAQAAAIERAIGSGLATGKGMIRTRRVAVGALAGLQGAKVAFLAGELRASEAEIASVAARLSILTVTSDLPCVKAGHCAVGVSNGAHVQITVSRAAMRAARIQFGSAFLMLIKEI